MPTISDNYHDNLIETMKGLANNARWFASSINLGGVPGSGGGSGGPPGGFYGQLIQSQVAYDTTEAAVQGGPVGSGWSLVDNLNHIRYSILNSQSLPLVIQDEGTLVASGIPILNFTGPGVTASLTGSSVTIAVTGSGGGGETGTTVIWQDCTSQVPAAGDNYTISQPAISGTIKVFLNGLLQKPTNITQTSVSFHTTFGAISGDELVATYLASGIPLASGIIVYDDGVLIASGVFKLNFANSLVTYAGGIATVSGMSTDTKKVLVTSADTTEGYLQNKIRPGSGVTITLTSGGANEFLQITSTSSADTYKSKIVSTDTTEDYLQTKLRPASGIYITTISGTANSFLNIGYKDIGCRAYSSSGMTIPDSTDYPLAFDSERWDTDNIHVTTAGTNGRLVCRTPGRYFICGMVKFASNAVGNRGVKIKLNAANTPLAGQFFPNVGANSWYATVSTVYDLVENDYVTLWVYQNSTGTLSLQQEANISPEFAMQRIG
jgi:hypothetical protein